MHVEADFFRTRRPELITEAVHVLSIVSRIERMITGGDAFLVDQVLVVWADNLRNREGCQKPLLGEHSSNRSKWAVTAR